LATAKTTTEAVTSAEMSSVIAPPVTPLNGVHSESRHGRWSCPPAADRGCRPVAPAVVGGAQVRTALEHLARNAWLGWMQAATLTAAARVARDATGPGGVTGMTGAVPVGGPLPDIADHIQQPKTV